VITAPAFAGRRYGVFGLARSGRASVAALAASGADVWAWDDGTAARDAFAGPLTDLNSADLSGLAAIVVSPGVPHSAPIFARAAAAGVPVVGDIELFAQARSSLPPHTVVGITGTNGKSTTTALVHHLLVAAGRAAAMGGNIGLPILAQDPLPAGGTYVLELSSYQLEITQSLACDVAVLTNITPDHLERHGSMAAYAGAKARIFQQQQGGLAVVGDTGGHDVLAGHEGPVVRIADVAIPGEQAEWPALQGPHNLENARAAVAAVRALGLTDAEIAAGLKSFPGLAHRMERLGVKRGLDWVNDSKATNADSTAPALKAFANVQWIAGGRPKRDASGRADLAAVLPHLGAVKRAFLIGEAAAEFAEILQPHLPVVHSGTMRQAVRDVLDVAAPGDVVLLSPACASFDQYTDFEARGDDFRALVGAL
jgi:UDP-N-acetylmuramoylalanine--D-glutamate ligase